MLLKIHPDNPDPRKLKMVIDCLNKGGVIIYPTDTVYSIGCDIRQIKALQKVAQLKGIKLEKANFSLVCTNLSQLSEYTKHVETRIYKLMKKVLPGPYTFILNASNSVPKLFQSKKKTVGIRVPDHSVPHIIVEHLGSALVATSVHDDDEIIEYTTDPELIHERYGDKVDIVIDSGYGHNEASTVLNCTDGDVEIIRQGIGEIEEYL